MAGPGWVLCVTSVNMIQQHGTILSNTLHWTVSNSPRKRHLSLSTQCLEVGLVDVKHDKFFCLIKFPCGDALAAVGQYDVTPLLIISDTTPGNKTQPRLIKLFKSKIRPTEAIDGKCEIQTRQKAQWRAVRLNAALLCYNLPLKVP